MTLPARRTEEGAAGHGLRAARRSWERPWSLRKEPALTIH